MLAFAIFAVAFVSVLIIAVIYLYPSSDKPTTIPGLEPTSKEDGNFPDISRAGSLHEFLMDLHKQYGQIASFWWGTTFTVSIASAKLFKEHMNVFDRPPELFMLFEPLIGKKCIQYANGTDGRARRAIYDKCLTHDAIKKYFNTFQDVADDLVKKWTGLVKEEHIPLSQYMSMFALKAVMISLFGDTMKNDKEILAFRKHYDICWNEMEHRLTEAPDAVREKAFQDALQGIKDEVKKVVLHRRQNPAQHGEELAIDLILDIGDEEQQICDGIAYIAMIMGVLKTRLESPPENREWLFIDAILDQTDDQEQRISECIVFVIGGFHTTGNLLTWAFYFMASHPDVQEKVYEEIKTVLGKEDVDHSNMANLKYVRQVLDETLRCAVVAPWAARFQDFDSELGGHKIPKNTPVIHALGVTLQDETVWPLPDKFDPDRFSEKNAKDRATLAYSPFGFAGKRKCPGYRFSYAEATVCLVTLIRKFKVHMVEGQVVTPVHGLVTAPADEVWLTISKRD